MPGMEFLLNSNFILENWMEDLLPIILKGNLRDGMDIETIKK